MATSITVLASCMLLVAVVQANYSSDEFVAAVIRDIEDDKFTEVQTTEIPAEKRKKRSVLSPLGRFGGYGNGIYDNTGFPDGCGAYPTGRVRFQTCFSQGSRFFQRNNFVQNYQRAGTYGDCLNYFNSLPLTNVAAIADGYTGVLNGPAGRGYNVAACQKCFGGNSGIAIQGINRPYNHLIRNFIFRINMGVNRAYDGYNGYGREYGYTGLYGYNGAVGSRYAGYGTDCTGSNCGGFLNAGRFAGPGCVGSRCGINVGGDYLRDNGCGSGRVC